MKIMRFEKLLSYFADVHRQSRFITRRRVFMQNAFVDSFVNCRNRRRQQFLTLIFIARGYRRAKFLDLRPQITAIAAIYGAAFFILSDALFG